MLEESIISMARPTILIYDFSWIRDPESRFGWKIQNECHCFSLMVANKAGGLDHIYRKTQHTDFPQEKLSINFISSAGGEVGLHHLTAVLYQSKSPMSGTCASRTGWQCDTTAQMYIDIGYSRSSLVLFPHSKLKVCCCSSSQVLFMPIKLVTAIKFCTCA